MIEHGGNKLGQIKEYIVEKTKGTPSKNKEE